MLDKKRKRALEESKDVPIKHGCFVKILQTTYEVTKNVISSIPIPGNKWVMSACKTVGELAMIGCGKFLDKRILKKLVEQEGQQNNKTTKKTEKASSKLENKKTDKRNLKKETTEKRKESLVVSKEMSHGGWTKVKTFFKEYGNTMSRTGLGIVGGVVGFTGLPIAAVIGTKIIISGVSSMLNKKNIDKAIEKYKNAEPENKRKVILKKIGTCIKTVGSYLLDVANKSKTCKIGFEVVTNIVDGAKEIHYKKNNEINKTDKLNNSPSPPNRKTNPRKQDEISKEQMVKTEEFGITVLNEQTVKISQNGKDNNKGR